MNIQKTLLDFKSKIDPEIEKYLNSAIAEARERDLFVSEALKYVKKMILAGGKRLRPALMYYGYIGAGGKDRKKILETAASIELIHFFLLIHDDIIDKDNKRHGIDTMHFHYDKMGKLIFRGSDSGHFGNSMAIIIGDMVSALGNQLLFNSKFDAGLVIKALIKLQRIVSNVVIGQSQDVYIEYRKKASEREVLKMYENKTAKYTIEGPLHLGAILAGAKDELLDALSKYAVPVGIAFQIQDDILGIFGSEKKLGKPVGSDIEEGKQTLLVVKAGEKADRSQLKKMNYLLGKPNLNHREIEEFRNIITDTGSLDYAKNLARKLITKGKQALISAKIKKETKDFLLGIADYMISREL
jgi:geranylgeranyl diphosphate synthase type I